MQVSEQNTREQIAEELADLVQRQKLIIECNDALGLLTNSKVDASHREMAEEDIKNLRHLESVMISLGMVAVPKDSTLRIVAAQLAAIVDQGSGPVEKLGAYINLKQSQIMSCHLLHKTAQIVKPDLRQVLTPIDAVYATFTSQLVALNSFFESSSVEYFTGLKAKTGIFGRMRDAMATVTGSILSKTMKPMEEMEVIPVLEADHRKVEALFKEIEESNDKEQTAQLFKQLKADLTAHSIAEEETVYRRFAGAEGMEEIVEDSQQEHEDLRALLDETSDLLGKRAAFMEKVQELKNVVTHHVEEEENEMFKLIRAHSSEEERIGLTGEFLAAKVKVQNNLGTEDFVASAPARSGGTDASV